MVTITIALHCESPVPFTFYNHVNTELTAKPDLGRHYVPSFDKRVIYLTLKARLTQLSQVTLSLNILGVRGSKMANQSKTQLVFYAQVRLSDRAHKIHSVSGT